jgi:hypothetical protein
VAVDSSGTAVSSSDRCGRIVPHTSRRAVAGRRPFTVRTRTGPLIRWRRRGWCRRRRVGLSVLPSAVRGRPLADPRPYTPSASIAPRAAWANSSLTVVDSVEALMNEATAESWACFRASSSAYPGPLPTATRRSRHRDIASSDPPLVSLGAPPPMTGRTRPSTAPSGRRSQRPAAPPHPVVRLWPPGSSQQSGPSAAGDLQAGCRRARHDQHSRLGSRQAACRLAPFRRAASLRSRLTGMLCRWRGS